MLAQTLERCRGDGFSARPIIVAAESHADLVDAALRGTGLRGDVVLEPVRRDSCAAIIVGAMLAQRRDKDALVLVVASDHSIPDAAAFRAAAHVAMDVAQRGFIVTFGVKPTEPATGYGYIAPSRERAGGVAWRVASFVEKPEVDKAVALVSEGCLWNSGNFLFRARDLLGEAKRLAPKVYDAAARSLAAARSDQHGLCLAATEFAAALRISFDRAIMEKTDRAAVVPVTYAWRDLGTWDAVAGSLVADQDRNVVQGPAIMADSRDCMVLSTHVPTALVGCEGLIVVTSPQGVLVARKGTSDHVRELGAQFNARAAPVGNKADAACEIETLDTSSAHCVSRITIPLGQSFAPERGAASRHWFVVRGRISVKTNGEDVIHQQGQILQSQTATEISICNVASSDSVLIEIVELQPVDSALTETNEVDN